MKSKFKEAYLGYINIEVKKNGAVKWYIQGWF